MKKKPKVQYATDEQLQEYRRQKFIRDTWESDMIMIRSIADGLAVEYDYYKGRV